MKSRKFLLLIALLVISSLVLAACQPAATTDAPEVEATEETEEMGATEEAVEAEPVWTQGLRQAIAAAIDREVIVDRVFEGRNVPAYSMVPEDYPYTTTQPFFDKYGTRDLDMAISLLEAEGYSEENPFSLILWYPPEHYGTTTADVMQVIKEQLEETGMIEVELQSMNWAEYVDGFVNGDLPFFILGWFPDFADPDTW
ncbi:MAG TPA: hypothetical protein DF984_00300, partial [Anaerolineaceae bacterium]|nr:hypothetical protein [Anaerolineaceae bacterium]